MTVVNLLVASSCDVADIRFNQLTVNIVGLIKHILLSTAINEISVLTIYH